jgi:tRNA(Ile)-lysidine synthase
MKDKTTTSKDFFNAVEATINKFNMLAQTDSILIAVSGGPDSVALVLTLLEFKEKYDLTIAIAHVNHMLRGEESLRDEAFVKQLADKFSLPFHLEQVDVKTYAKTHGLSIEEAGREVRYDFFKHLSKSHGYKKVVTGHHKNDNAELVLMNLLRGSGSKGLCGIPPVRDHRYLRPLIQVSKKQITAFLEDLRQDYMFDSTNEDTSYLRNRIRYELLPHLKSEYNPEITEALNRLSYILSREEEYLDIETNKFFKECLLKIDSACVTFSKSVLARLHPAMQNRVLRKGIRIIKNDLKRISYVHMNDIIDFCFNKSSGVSLDLPGQIRVYKKRDVIIIKKEDMPLRKIGEKHKTLKRMTQKK